MISDDIIKAQLKKTLDKTSFSDLGAKYEGKVRDCYTRDGRRIIVVTDRISAFDVVLGTIPSRGKCSTRSPPAGSKPPNLAPNHVLSIPDPTVMVATECQLLSVEFVMRAYLTGVTSTSIWYHYERGARRFCGHALPDGMRKNQKLEKAILTPSTKAEKGDHDKSVSREEILAAGALSAADFDRAAAMCARVFAFGQEQAAKRGLILVDTKYEVGRRPDGTLCFIDEIHTPDARYWYADDYQARFDRKEEPRGLDKNTCGGRWPTRVTAATGRPRRCRTVRIEAARRYIALRLITGRPFVPDTEEPLARIRRNLKV